MIKASIYAVQKQGPINIGAGNNDYICKVFARTEKFHVVVQVSPSSYEGYARALLEGSPAEVLCDPSKMLGIEMDRPVIQESVQDAITGVRTKSVRTT